jgi:hypothetical protein
MRLIKVLLIIINVREIKLYKFIVAAMRLVIKISFAPLVWKKVLETSLIGENLILIKEKKVCYSAVCHEFVVAKFCPVRFLIFPFKQDTYFFEEIEPIGVCNSENTGY